MRCSSKLPLASFSQCIFNPFPTSTFATLVKFNLCVPAQQSKPECGMLKQQLGLWNGKHPLLIDGDSALANSSNSPFAFPIQQQPGQPPKDEMYRIRFTQPRSLTGKEKPCNLQLGCTARSQRFIEMFPYRFLLHTR